MKKIILKIKETLSTENLFSVIILGSLTAAILLLFFQGYWFSFTGDWLIPGDQLAIGIVTSLISSFSFYKAWVFVKLLNEDA